MSAPVYVITDPAAPLPVAEQVLAAARGGATMIQVRDKSMCDAEFGALVVRLLPAVSALGARLIVNDRAEVAMQTGAHGLHIGQTDGDPAEIRRRLPATMMLGLSIETEEQCRYIPEGVAYIGAGPVRATKTKPDHATPVGFDGLARIVAAAGRPTYAIGGLGHGDAARLKAIGAAGLAVVSAVVRAPDPQAATAALIAEWRSA